MVGTLLVATGVWLLVSMVVTLTIGRAMGISSRAYVPLAIAELADC